MADRDEEFKALWNDLCSVSRQNQALQADNTRMASELEQAQQRVAQLEPQIQVMSDQLAAMSEAREWQHKEQSAEFYSLINECADKVGQLKQAHHEHQACRSHSDELLDDVREMALMQHHRIKALEGQLAGLHSLRHHLEAQIGQTQHAMQLSSSEHQHLTNELRSEMLQAREAHANSERELVESNQYLHSVIAELSALLLRGKQACATLASARALQPALLGDWKSPPHPSTPASELDVWVAEAEAELREEVRRSVGTRQPGAHQEPGELEKELENARTAMGNLQRLQELLQTGGADFFAYQS